MKLSATTTRSGGLEVFAKMLRTATEQEAAVNEAARSVRNIARRLIRSNDKSGRVYTRPRGEGRQKYRASAPGESPARFTGHLAEHVRMYPAKRNRVKKVAWVGSTSPHIHLLEFGTLKMRPRPVFAPAMRQARGQAFRNIKAATRRDLDKAKRQAVRHVRTRGKR